MSTLLTAMQTQLSVNRDEELFEKLNLESMEHHPNGVMLYRQCLNEQAQKAFVTASMEVFRRLFL
jgi:hypothetical protein